MWKPPPPGGFPPDLVGERTRSPVALIIVIVLGVALIAGGAFTYFMFLSPGEPTDAAHAIIDEYFNAVGSGDTEKVKSLHTSDTQPSSEQLRAMSAAGGMLTYSDFELKTIDESAGEMSVEVVDFVITVSFMGESETLRMSELQSVAGESGKMVIELKEENGKWLINEPVIFEPFEMTVTDTPDRSGATSLPGGC